MRYFKEEILQNLDKFDEYFFNQLLDDLDSYYLRSINEINLRIEMNLELDRLIADEINL
jgi:hypothetical protein